MLFLKREIKNRRPALRTIDGPAGVSMYHELAKPKITAKQPTRLAKKAICSGVLEKVLAVAAGIMSKACILYPSDAADDLHRIPLCTRGTIKHLTLPTTHYI